MGIIRRAKNTIVGLNDDLATLQANINKAEADAKVREGALADLTTEDKTSIVVGLNEVLTKLNSEVARAGTAETGLDGRLVTVEGDNTVDGSIAKALSDGKAYTNQEITTLTDGKVKTLEDLTAKIDGTSDVEGSFREAIKNLIGGAPEALDTLKEISDALEGDGAIAETLRTLVVTSISNAKAEIKGDVTEAFDTMKEVEDALNLINDADTVVGSYKNAVKVLRDYTDSNKLDMTQNLADLTDKQAARDVMSLWTKAEVANAIRVGGALPKSDALSVSGKTITLSFAPKNGVILNFGRVSTVKDGTPYEVTVQADTDDADGKTYIIDEEETNQFDGLTALIQYQYVVPE